MFKKNRVTVEGNAVDRFASQEGVGLFLYHYDPEVEEESNHFHIITNSSNPSTVVVGVEKLTGKLTLKDNQFDLCGPLKGAKRVGIPTFISDSNIGILYQDKENNRFIRKELE